MTNNFKQAFYWENTLIFGPTFNEYKGFYVLYNFEEDNFLKFFF